MQYRFVAMTDPTGSGEPLGTSHRYMPPCEPIIDTFEPWLQAQLDTVSGKSPTAKAIRYALSH